MKYFVTFSVPVEAENPADALDLGWDKVIDPDGSAEGLVEHVSETQPALPGAIAA